MDENEDEAANPVSEENWIKQKIWKFIMYVIHHRHSMTPEQLKQKPFEEIFKKQHEKLDTEEGESNEEEEVSTRSSENSEQDSESDTSTEDEQKSNTTETPQIHNVLNNTINDEHDSIYDEDESSQEENVKEIELHENNGEQNVKQENKLLDPQKSQNKILSLTHLLKMNQSLIQLKHLKFIMF